MKRNANPSLLFFLILKSGPFAEQSKKHTFNTYLIPITKLSLVASTTSVVIVSSLLISSILSI